MTSGLNKSLERVTLSNKPKLIITKKLQNQIDWLHKKCGSTEWSGELITREIGKITDLDNWTIIAEDIFLVDKGSPGFTGYNFNEGAFKAADVMELYDKFDGLMEGTHKSQHLHTHHSMNTFFSGTDWSQLNDRALESNYFMMLITNFKNEHIAKVAFKAKNKTTSSGLSFANDVENSFEELEFVNEESKDVLVVMDCIVEVEEADTNVEINDLQQVFQSLSQNESCDIEDLQNVIKLINNKLSQVTVDQYFEDRYNYVCEQSKPAFNSFPKSNFQQNTKSYQQDLWGRFDEPLNKSQKREKGIMEMTDKEWFKEESGVLMGKKEGFVVLNKFLDKGAVIKDATSPIDKLIGLNTTMTTATEIMNWGQSLSYCFRDLFDSLYSHGDDVDFENVLIELFEYFERFNYNRVIATLCEQLEAMLDYSFQNQM